MDFKSGLDTIDHYQIAQAKNFYPNTSFLGAICDSSKSKILKMVELKNRKNLTSKKSAATPTFCKQNFFHMHYVDFINTLLTTLSLLLLPNPHRMRVARD